MAKTFHLGDVLSITTDILLAPSGIGAVYVILNYMAGDSLMTHQLPRVSRECRPHLLRQHPRLDCPEMRAAVETLREQLSRTDDRAKVAREWLASQVAIYGETLEVEPIPADDHERKDPWDELVAMRGTDEGIVPVKVK